MKTIHHSDYVRKDFSDFLALPESELRSLVLIITLHSDIRLFVRLMLKVKTAVRADKPIAPHADQGINKILTHIREAMEDGDKFIAANTAFFAAMFAYQNSFDFLREMCNYFDRCRK